MTAKIIQDKATPSRLEEMLQSIEELPSIPETLLEIIKVLDDPDSGPSDLAAVVRLDAPLMAKVLRLANSPYYSSKGNLTDINRCLTVLGYRTVRQVAICLTVASSLLTAVARSSGRLDYRELWRHSVVAAALAKYLACWIRYPEPEEVFTAGLLHDLGKFVLEIHDPSGYDRVILARRQSGRQLVDMERETYGCDHAQIAEAFGRFWRFPELLSASLGAHHGLLPPTTTARIREVATLVQFADRLAHHLEPPRSDLGYAVATPEPPASWQGPAWTAATLAEHTETMQAEITRAAVFLDLS